MQITQKQEGEIYVFSLNGHFDARSAGEVENKLNSAISQKAQKLLIDLSGAEYISSAGLRVLLAIAKKLKEKDGQIKLCCLQPYVKEVFDVAGFTQIFKIYNTYQQGINSF
ncbi:STAS domain-containing protein [Candidatus Aerophobetes bacterium]|nr:STAS domain-containing protein [Candidatus Aerophobetes bacterium]